MRPNTQTQPNPGVDIRRPRPTRPIENTKGGPNLESAPLEIATANLAAAGFEFVEIPTHHPTVAAPRSASAEPAAA